MTDNEMPPRIFAEISSTVEGFSWATWSTGIYGRAKPYISEDIVAKMAEALRSCSSDDYAMVFNTDEVEEALKAYEALINERGEG